MLLLKADRYRNSDFLNLFRFHSKSTLAKSLSLEAFPLWVVNFLGGVDFFCDFKNFDFMLVFSFTYEFQSMLAFSVHFHFSLSNCSFKCLFLVLLVWICYLASGPKDPEFILDKGADVKIMLINFSKMVISKWCLHNIDTYSRFWRNQACPWSK